MVSFKSINFLTLIIVVLIVTIENSNAENKCLDEITKQEVKNPYQSSARKQKKMKISFNGQEAFEFAYINLSVYKTVGSKRSFLRSYTVGLFNAVMSIIFDNTIKDPKTWCEANINPFVSMENCYNDLNLLGFNPNDSSKQAFINAYFNVVPSKLNRGMGTTYYKYILQRVLPFVKKSRAVGPVEYCERGFKSTYVFVPNADQNKLRISAECIDQLTDFGMLERQFSGRDALIFIYFNLCNYNTTGLHRQDHLFKYYFGFHKEILEILSNFDNDVIQSPMNWCLENISKYYETNSNNERENKCFAELGKMGFNSVDNGKAAFNVAYFYLTTYRPSSPIGMAYYQYALERILLIINEFNLTGPEEYCNTGFKSKSNENQMETVDFTSLPVNQFQTADHSITVEHDQNYFSDTNFQLPHAFTSDKDQNIPVDYTQLLENQSQHGGIFSFNQSEKNIHFNIDSNTLGESSSARDGMNPDVTNSLMFDQPLPDYSLSNEYDHYYSSNTIFDVPFGFVSDHDMRNPAEATQVFNEQNYYAGVQRFEEFPNTTENYHSPSSSAYAPVQSSYHEYDNYPYYPK